MSAPSAADRLESALASIAAGNDALRLVTSLDPDAARVAARASDARAAAGASLGPLDGCLLGVKDNIAVAGQPWTAGLAGWRDRIAARDAAVVARLRAAGAVIVAMLNMHEGALGATTDNPTWGRAANPLDPDRTPGGSSGGSGGAVAAGFVEAALGTDTMGSVRIPAAYCGLAGLKPTDDAVPREGLAFLSPSFDTIGPLARDAATLAAIHAAIRDPVPRRDTPLPPPPALTVGLPRQIAEVAVDFDVATAFDRARSVLEAVGARLIDVDLVGWHPGQARRGGLMLVEAEAAIALAELAGRPGAVSEALRGLLDYGHGLSSSRLVEALARIGAARRAAWRGLAEADVLLMPTAPQHAFRHADPVPDNQADLTALANFAGLPALCLPVAMPGLPGSVQLVGPDWSEAALCALGRTIERDLAGR